MLSLRLGFSVVVGVKSDETEAAETVLSGLLPSLGRRALGVTPYPGELDELKDPLDEA
jgi:hypothetical protein